ncbi:hypothetical protein ARSEF4850_005823 [Beauveria asiatica]
MSTFGAPGQLPSTKPAPPQRGSFPLDHDGECKSVMSENLMAKDDFKNLGYAEDSSKTSATGGEPEQGVKGELRW